MSRRKIIVGNNGIVDYGPDGPEPITSVYFEMTGSEINFKDSVFNFSGSTVNNLTGNGITDYTNGSFDFSGSIINLSGSVLTGSLKLASSFDKFETAASFSNFRVRNISSGGTFWHTMHVPVDFVSLDKLYLVFIPQGTGSNRQLTIVSHWSDFDQDIFTNTGSLVVVHDLTGSYPNGGLHRLDISSVLNNTIGPGMMVGLSFNNNTAPTLSMIGTMLYYYREL